MRTLRLVLNGVIDLTQIINDDSARVWQQKRRARCIQPIRVYGVDVASLSRHMSRHGEFGERVWRNVHNKMLRQEADTQVHETYNQVLVLALFTTNAHAKRTFRVDRSPF